MNDADRRNSEQVAYWNGEGGAHWVAQQAHTDTMLAPVAEALLALAAAGPAERVLDIGCGCGSTTLALAGRAAQVTGLDISAPMLAVARGRAAGLGNVAFVEGDAAVWQPDAPFDLLVSRFGVMFFGDPAAAFTALRGMARPGARLVFVCWRPITENGWMQVPLHAVYNAGVPRLPRPAPDEPGPFAFADAERVRGILTGAGWAEPRFTRLDLVLDIAAGKGIDAAVAQATQIGAASRALREAPADLRGPATEAIRAALAPFESGAHVALPGAMWLVESVNPAG